MKSVDIGITLARKLFERRGNPTGIHLTETELAAICGVAADLGRHSALRQVVSRIERSSHAAGCASVLYPTQKPCDCGGDEDWTRYAADMLRKRGRA